MKDGQCELSDGASWYKYRLNVVPHGGNPHIASEYVDDLATARKVKGDLIERGAMSVDIYDTVEGRFFE